MLDTCLMVDGSWLKAHLALSDTENNNISNVQHIPLVQRVMMLTHINMESHGCHIRSSRKLLGSKSSLVNYLGVLCEDVQWRINAVVRQLQQWRWPHQLRSVLRCNFFDTRFLLKPGEIKIDDDAAEVGQVNTAMPPCPPRTRRLLDFSFAVIVSVVPIMPSIVSASNRMFFVLHCRCFTS